MLFLDATLGRNPSYTWLNIIKGRRILEKGLKWRLGNDRNIRVWKDRWYPETSSFMIESDPRDRDSEELLVSFIDGEAQKWNEFLIDQVFSVQEARCIKSIPLGVGDVQDVLMWHFDKKGKYTVKSWYKMLSQLIEEGQQVVQGIGNQVWKKIWHFSLPRKIQGFIWKAVHGILTTRGKLAAKGILVNVECP
ncbi:hypothetical protein PTKIN_Ptkin11bG0120100 [Pterospermum kingtungense]